MLSNGSKMFLFNSSHTERKGNYIIQMRYVGETKFHHYGFGCYISELIQEIKERENKYCQYRIIELDTNKIIYFQ